MLSARRLLALVVAAVYLAVAPTLAQPSPTTTSLNNIDATLAPIRGMLVDTESLVATVRGQREGMDAALRRVTEAAEEARLTEQLAGLDGTLETLERNRARLVSLLSEAEAKLRQLGALR
jgi:ABC-type transporter Mla subunit MlaD